jgi:hypothetical protein
VTVQLVATPLGDDLDAAETIARLRAAHPKAEGPRPVPASAATWPPATWPPETWPRDTAGERR